MYGANGLGKKERRKKTGAMIKSFRLEGWMTKSRLKSRGGNGSGWPWPLSGGRSCCCWMSRSQPWTTRCVWSCISTLTGAARQYKIPVILVTHDLNEALKLGGSEDHYLFVGACHPVRALRERVKDNPVIREAKRFYESAEKRMA